MASSRSLLPLLTLLVIAQVHQWCPTFVFGPSTTTRGEGSSIAMRSRRFRKRDIEAFMKPSPMMTATAEQKDDEAFVEENIKGDPRGFAHASERLQKDIDFIMKMLRVNPRVVDYVHPEVFADEDVKEELQREYHAQGYGGWIYWHDTPYNFWGRGGRTKLAMMPKGQPQARRIRL